MKGLKSIVLSVAALAAAVSLSGCKFINDILSGEDGGQMVTSLVEKVGEALDAQVTVVEGNTLTYGTHRYTVNAEIDPATKEFKQPTASVTFTNFPAGYDEFEAVYEGLLGKSIAGATAMIPMAIELYARDAGTGERCFKLLCNSDSTVSGIVRILKTKLVPSQYGSENDSYIQRYMAAALLKGAVNTNAYTPEEPYTVEMTMSPNGVKDAELMGGVVTYVYILAKGWDSNQRGVDVFLPYDTEYYKIAGCSSCYTQCKNIRGTWPGLK
ncbi:MAG: hypothetical protein K5849_07120 [Bacteroidales bacterium]|nr:hypothetical protein [Bacteroidales bacterium]